MRLNVTNADPLSQSAYERKYSIKSQREGAWRFIACVGIIFVVFTVISILIGVAAIIVAAKAINKDTGNDGEIQAAKIIVDSLQSLDEVLPTEIKVIRSDQSCGTGWETMFSIEWPGTERGCWYEGRTMSYSDYESRRRNQRRTLNCGDPVNAEEAVT